jgi:hypothetical protein
MYNSIDKVDQRDDYFQCSPILGRYAIGYSIGYSDWHFQSSSGDPQILSTWRITSLICMNINLTNL